MAVATCAAAQTAVFSFDLPSQPLADSVRAVGRQTGANVLFTPEMTAGRQAPALKGRMTAQAALNRLVAGANLAVQQVDGRNLYLRKVSLVRQAEAAAPAAAASASPPPAPAPVADVPAPPEQVEEVVITGSRITRSDYSAASPTVTLAEQAIQQAGAATVEGVLNQMPQFTPSTGAATVFPNRGGQANINLRGLGTNRALVLLDGRRVQPSNPDGTIDTNILPNSLIASVETITGGASAAYGSDAMAGVVNFKLKRNFTGVQFDTQLSITDQEDGAAQSVSGLFGGDFAGKRGHAVLAVDYTNREPVQRKDRAFSRYSLLLGYSPSGIANLSANPPSQAAINSVFAGYGRPTPGPVNIVGFNADGTLFKQGPATSPVINYRGEYNDDILSFNNSVTYNVGQTYDIQLALKRFNGFGRVDYDLTDHVRVYGELLLTKYKAVTDFAPSLAPSTGPQILVPVTNPFIPADLRTLLQSRPSPNAPFPVQLITLNAPISLFDNRWTVYQFTTGASGDVPGRDWTWDIYGSFGKTKNTDYRRHIASSSAIQAFLNAPGGGTLAADPVQCQGGFNPFAVLTSDCATKVLRTATNDLTLEQRVVEGNLQGGLLDLPAGRLKFAIGADYRYNSYDYRSDPLLQIGDLSAGGVVLPAGGSAKVFEAYGEVLVPLLRDLPLMEKLDLDVGYRFSDYSTIGTVHAYRADLDWTVGGGLRLRGGYSRSVRAPSLQELFAASNTLNFAIGVASAASITGDPCDVRSSYRQGPNGAAVRALCLAQGISPNSINNFTYTSTTIYGTNTGNPDLEEERADTYSIGLVWRSPFSHPLLSRLQASVDYFDIAIDGAIGQLSLTTAVQLCFNANGSSNPSYSASNFYCQNVRRDASGGIANALVPTLNLSSYSTSGVDFQVDWAFGLDALGLSSRAGALSFNFVGTYLNDFGIQVLDAAPRYDYAGSTTGVTANVTPKWKLLTTATYSLGPVDLGVRWRAISKVKDASRVLTPTSTVPGVPRYDYFDLIGRWRVNDRLELRGGVNNLADKTPPQVGTSLGITDPATYDVLGRSFYLALRAKF